jgi:nitroreductase
MSKEAKTNNNDIHPLLRKRWSPRAFDDKPVDDKKIKNILEAARWAPSASNIQPWVFFVGFRGDETYNKIMASLVEFNQMWAVNAPVLILNCGKISKPDGHQNGVWQYDVGQALALMSMQVMDEGLYIHQMGGFDALKAAELFNLPEDVRAVTVAAIGYIGNPDMLHPRMQKGERAERERKEMDTFVFSDVYGQVSEIIK